MKVTVIDMKQETLRPGQEIVHGIDVITATIAAQAESDSAAILQEAKKEADAIALDYEQKAKKILFEAEEKAKKDSAAAQERAISAAANHKRNQLLFQKGALVEEAFDKALAALESLDGEAYFKLLSELLSAALKEYLASEKQTAEYEGKDYVSVNTLSLAMAKRDLALGKALIDSVSKELSEAGKTMTLAEADDRIGSGFVLIVGDIRMDSSLKTLITLQKSSLESEVFRILFA